ncbi:hypothetical protein SDC9_167070 [bioreactor metagenome]|uniref:Uncharacterized protein n=1 Tax=bioreactor metagenome TaxID=1076179 RepID=A0A645FYS6_9ZZZZ
MRSPSTKRGSSEDRSQMWGALRRSLRSPEENTDYSFSGAERATRRPAPERARSPEDSGNFRTHLRRSRAHWRTDLKCSLNYGEASVPRSKTFHPAAFISCVIKRELPPFPAGALLSVICFAYFVLSGNAVFVRLFGRLLDLAGF